MANQIFLDKDGLVNQVLNAPLDAEALRSDLPKLLELQKKLKSENKPFRILLDARQIQKADTPTRKQGVANLDQMAYSKIGIFGGKAYLNTLANFVLMATGKSGKIKIFVSEAEARSWLLSTDDQ